MLGKFPGESVACITAGIKQKEFMRFRTGPGNRVGFASRLSLEVKGSKAGVINPSSCGVSSQVGDINVTEMGT